MFKRLGIVGLVLLLALTATAAMAGDGGLHLVGYCQDQDQVLVLTERSVQGWGCMDEDGEITPINFVRACREEYNGERPYPNFGDFFNPSTVSCGEGPATGIRGYLGSFLDSEEEGLDLGPYCQYHTEWNGSEWVVTDQSDANGHGCEDSSGVVHEIDMQAACYWMYPQRATRPISNANNPWGWGCRTVETYGQG